MSITRAIPPQMNVAMPTPTMAPRIRPRSRHWVPRLYLHSSLARAPRGSNRPRGRLWRPPGDRWLAANGDQACSGSRSSVTSIASGVAASRIWAARGNGVTGAWPHWCARGPLAGGGCPRGERRSTTPCTRRSDAAEAPGWMVGGVVIRNNLMAAMVLSEGASPLVESWDAVETLPRRRRTVTRVAEKWTH
jgi:hypothetical protein